MQLWQLSQLSQLRQLSTTFCIDRLVMYYQKMLSKNKKGIKNLNQSNTHQPSVMQNKKKAVMAIDIEARGQGVLSHGIVSIGVCIGHPYQQKVFYKNRFDILPMENQKMEPRCWSEFWINHQDKLGRMQKYAKPAQEQIKAFRRLIDKWDSTHDLYIIADNPAFDFGMIDTYLDLFQEPTLSYKKVAQTTHNTLKLSYRPLHDCDNYARGYFNFGFDKPYVSNKNIIRILGLNLDASDHDHMPENDAELMYKVHVALVNKATKR